MECTKPRECYQEPAPNKTSELSMLKKYHKESFKFVNEGLNLEDKSKLKEATVCYEKGLRSIEAALKVPKFEVLSNPEDENEYDKIVSKLLAAQNEVEFRLEVLKEDRVNENTLPSSELDIYNKDTAPRFDAWQDVKELISIREGVNLFHVSKNGEVSPWTSPCQLEIFQILKDTIDTLNISPSAFMKCGEWVYPMEPGKSPVLKSKDRTYMFPDISVEQGIDSAQFDCIGVVLSDFVSDHIVTRFERVLACYSDFKKVFEQQLKEKPARPPLPSSLNRKGTRAERTNGNVEEINATPAVVANRELVESTSDNKAAWSDKISSGINIGSQWISWGLLKGAAYTSILVEKGANNIRERLRPNDEPTVVDPDISRNIRQIHQATGSVVQISSYLITALASMTMNLGKKVAPHVLYHGQKVLPEKYKLENNEGSQKKLEDLRKVAVSGLEGFGMMFLALEQSGKNLYRTISVATVQTLQHKYGDEVGDVTQDAMGAAGNTVLAYWNVKKLGPKALAKRAVKDTGKAMILNEDDVKPIK